MRKLPYRLSISRTTERTTEIDTTMIQIAKDPLLTAATVATELAERIDLTLANVSILKTGKARAIRFSTLEAICRELDCQPGELLRYDPASGQSEYEPDNQNDDDQGA